jgi:2-polyprenyl-6-methoxyphenol hydroxylase-like FAD-dependent oxidoreductase
MSDTQVLITGAGPTGLVLAIWLKRLGVPVRIVDQAVAPGTTSRALVVHARTLEFYRQVGLAETVVERALEMTSVNLWAKGKKAARVFFGPLGQGMSPFPYLLILPQDEHERLLIEHLAEHGVQVERRTQLLGFEDSGGRVLARLRRPDGTEEACEAAYLAGCDGARSTARDVLGAGFPGGTYSHLFYVADVEASGPVMDREIHVALDDTDFLVVFPMKGAGRARLIGTVRQEGEGEQEGLSWDDVTKDVIGRLGITVERLNWFSTYRVHHRVADHFRRGRAFLLGDAAHIHSPVGGQGMNTGIGDAVNLAWKLAAVLQGADAAILDTYEPERIAFARRLVATTDRAFTVVTSSGPIARRMRVDVAPRLLPMLFAARAFRRLMFRTVSQIAINYRDSSLSEGRAGNVRGGDRLPWVTTGRTSDRGSDNFSPLTSLDWQVHVYGGAAAPIAEVCARRGMALQTFPWQSAASRAGLARGAVYLVRPDGYVGLADPEASPARVERYLDRTVRR